MLQGKGNIGKPDTPGVTTQEMQRIMDEIPREVIVPAFNALIDALLSESAAADSGAEVPEGLPEDTDKTVQAVLDAIVAYIDAHKKDQKNPHAVKAEQVGAYTKEQTDNAIADKIVEIGSSDMQSAVYDPQRKKQDIFAYADKVADLRMKTETYDPQKKGQDVFATIDAAAAKYEAKLSLDGWVASTSEEQAGGYTLAQEVALTAVTPGAPTVSAASEFLTGCGYDPTGVAATDEILDEVLAIVNAGVTSSLDGGKVRTVVKEKPAADIVLHWVIRTEVS